MTERKASPADDLMNVGRGLMMGGADIIPGVSGGTVALILGIYERLVTAISHVDLELVGYVKRRQWSGVARHIDLRFLVALGLGIAIAILALARVLEYLLQYQRPYILSAFFGLILVSSLLVGRMIGPPSREKSLFAVGVVVAAALVAFWLVGQPFMEPRPGYAYLFLCAMIAICAMILPGVSGAFILFVLGKYSEMVAVIEDMTHLHFTVENLTTLAVFASGCAVGLIAFSKVLRWLLVRYHWVTMAALCGLMIGSLRKLWPFQIDRTPDKPLKEKIYENYLPESISGEVLLCLGLAVAAVLLVWTLDRFARKRAAARRALSG